MCLCCVGGRGRGGMGLWVSNNIMRLFSIYEIIFFFVYCCFSCDTYIIYLFLCIHSKLSYIFICITFLNMLPSIFGSLNSENVGECCDVQ